MAQFTPQLEYDPRGGGGYGGVNAPGLQPDESGKYRGAGLKVASEVAGTAVEGVKGYIKQSIEQQGEKIQDKWIEDLTNERNKLESGEAKLVAPGGGASAARVGPSLLDQSSDQPSGVGYDGPMPQEVKDYGHKLEAIEGARRSGRIDLLRYDADVRKLSQQYRSMFPSFVDTIDEATSRVTGRQVANKVINNLMGEINSYAQVQKDKSASYMKRLQHEDVEAALNQVDPSGRMYRGFAHAFMAGGPEADEAALHMENIVGPVIGSLKNLDYALKRQTLKKDETAEQQQQNSTSLDAALSHAGLALWVGNTLGSQSADDLPKLADALRGKSEEEIMPLIQEAATHRAAVVAQLTQLMNDPKYAGRVKNPGEDEQRIKNVTRLWDEQINLLQNGEHGLLHWQTQLNAARLNDFNNQQVIENPARAAVQLPMFKQMCDTNPSICDRLVELGGGNDASKISHALMSRFDIGTDDTPRTADGKVNAAGLSGEKFGKVLEMTQDIVENPKLSPKLKMDYVTKTLGPNAYGWIGALKSSYITADGRRVKGDVDVLSRIGDPKLLKELHNLGPDAINQAFDFIKNAAGQDVIRKEIKNLEAYGKYTPTTIRGQTRPPRVSIGWDSDSNHFVANFNPIYGHDRTEATIRNSIESLNTVMDTIGNFAPYVKDAEGQKPAIFIAHVLHDNGHLNFQGIPNTLPEMIGNVLGRGIQSEQQEEGAKGMYPHSGRRQKELLNIQPGSK